MKRYVALLRGINVGGNRMLPMKELKAVLEKAGCMDVQTYIQSGNVVLSSTVADAARLAKRLATAIGATHGFEPRVLVLSGGDLQNAVDGNPFPEAIRNPKSLHLFFLAETPRRPDLNGLEDL